MDDEVKVNRALAVLTVAAVMLFGVAVAMSTTSFAGM